MNILSLLVGRDGCSGYRVKNPLNQISRAKKTDQVFFVDKNDGESVFDLIMGANVIVMRQQHDEFMRFIKTHPELKGDKKLLVVDMDDDIFNISPFNTSYKWAGLEEVKYHGEWLWKNGKNDFDTKRNKEIAQNYIDMLHNADLITVSTPYLKDRIKKIAENDNVEVLPNAINFIDWKPWPFIKTDEIRIGWTGGISHYEDWYSIKDSLLKIFKKYPNLKLVIQGAAFAGLIKEIPHEIYDWIDWEGHPYKAASLNIDIAIIPLTDTLFNHSKSSIKWYEFSALGIPSVVSNVLPYKEDVKHNDTAICYNNSDEFEKGLIRLIEDVKLRKTIGDNARKWVEENRDIKNIAEDYLKVYHKYLDKKICLNKQ